MFQITGGGAKGATTEVKSYKTKRSMRFSFKNSVLKNTTLPRHSLTVDRDGRLYCASQYNEDLPCYHAGSWCIYDLCKMYIKIFQTKHTRIFEDLTEKKHPKNA